MKRILVTGAGGFIGHHLVKRLRAEGNWVRGVDVKLPEFEPTAAHSFLLLDLRYRDHCWLAAEGVDEIYQLAADMGGIGYITSHLSTIARNNTLINVSMLEAARRHGIKNYLYTSSACVYAQDKQTETAVTPLKESDAYPAAPEAGYGWEKLYAEQMCHYYQHDYGIQTRIVRFHNVYGPLGTWDGGREKSPAALCRKIARAKLDPLGTSIDIWGDGRQTRSYMHIDDCIEGLIRLMASGYTQPLNLGTDQLVSIDGLADIIQVIADTAFTYEHVAGPQGVRGRNSDNSQLRAVLGWEPKIQLEEGLKPTYVWIEEQVRNQK